MSSISYKIRINWSSHGNRAALEYFYVWKTAGYKQMQKPKRELALWRANCISKTVASSSKEGIVPLCWTFVRLYLQHCVRFWGLLGSSKSLINRSKPRGCEMRVWNQGWGGWSTWCRRSGEHGIFTIWGRGEGRSNCYLQPSLLS